MKQTMYHQPAAGDRTITVWNAEDGWYYCVSGTYRGIYSESDDIGPFANAASAEADAADYVRLQEANASD